MYSIPVALWILNIHPIHASLCYVRPTPDMQIRICLIFKFCQTIASISMICHFSDFFWCFRSSMYNIPVALWILDTHPIHAPICYVRPTPDMQIKVSQVVDGNGKIYLPYLHEWDAANSDILGKISDNWFFFVKLQ